MFTQKGYSPIVLLLILLAGLVLGIYLVQQRTNLLPKAFFFEEQEPYFAISDPVDNPEPTESPEPIPEGEEYTSSRE